MKNSHRLSILFSVLSLLPAAQAQTYTWANFVGNPTDTTGGTNNAGTVNAQFHQPWGMALDSAGNLFVADTVNDSIRKVAPNGLVSTFVGINGTAGTADGTGSVARFDEPSSIAFDASGNFYVADYGNQTIRYVTSAGVVTTPYGTAKTVGHNDGIGNAATFNSPTGVAVDASGNVFVTDYNNYVIRKIVPSTGQVSTPYGTVGMSGSTGGQGPAARFYHPVALAFDKSGNLYVADAGNDIVRKITPGGLVSTLAGSAGLTGSTDGTGSAARFGDDIAGISTDSSGNVYVADGGNFSIRKITPAGVVTTIGGGTVGVENGIGTAAQFNYPVGLAVNSTASEIYVSDYLNNRISRGTTAPNWHSVKVTPVANAATGVRAGAAHSSWNLYFYKGTDNNIWSVFLANGQWVQEQLTTSANVIDWLAYEPTYGTLNYEGTGGTLWCVYFNTVTGKWTNLQLGTPPQGVSVSGDIVVDANGGWNNIYYRGSDEHMYAAYFNGTAWVHLSLGGIANVAADLTVEGNNHVIYYKDSNANLWCFYNNGKTWAQLQLTTNGNVGGAVAADLVANTTVYYKSINDGSAWCAYSTGGAWKSVQLDAGANMPGSAPSGGIAPYTAADCTLFLDNNGQANTMYYNGTSWGHFLLGDGGWNITGGLSLQPINHWLFTRRSDGHVVLFYLD